MSERTRARVAALARSTGRPMAAVLDDAVEAYEAQTFWSRFAAETERTMADPQARAEIEAERERESGALADGFDPEDRGLY